VKAPTDVVRGNPMNLYYLAKSDTKHRLVYVIAFMLLESLKQYWVKILNIQPEALSFTSSTSRALRRSF
jgi:hypothetical protein